MAHAKLRPGGYYHIYNRGNNREDVFRSEREYTSFLERYAHHVAPSVDTFAYCLMRNHFHLLIRVRPIDEWPNETPTPDRRFANLFSGYAKWFNAKHQRTGSLFGKPFGRIEVTDDAYFATLVRYLHRNPQRHRFVDDFRDWPHSSYHALTSKKPTRLARRQTIEWFGGQTGFQTAHYERLPIEPDFVDHDFESMSE